MAICTKFQSQLKTRPATPDATDLTMEGPPMSLQTWPPHSSRRVAGPVNIPYHFKGILFWALKY